MGTRNKKVLAFLLCILILTGTIFTPAALASATTTGVLGTDGSPRHVLGEAVGITLSDPDLNTDPGTQQNVVVNVKSSVTDNTAGINVTLVENGNDSNIFSGKFKLAAASSEAPEPKELGAAIGETVTVTYADAADDTGNPATLTTAFDVVASKAAAPTASQDHGIVSDGTPIELSSGDGAEIYFTTNGNTPTSMSTHYVNPGSMPVISGHTVIKAVAVKDGMADSDVAAFEYNIQGIRVQVMNPANDTAMPGARVEVKRADNGQFVCDGQTGPDGTVLLNPVPPMADGNYAVRAYPSDLSPFAVSNPINVTLSNGGFSDGKQTIALNATVLTGTVVDSDHNAVNSGWVDVELKTGDNQGNWFLGMPIYSNGTFNLPSMPPADYRLRANPPDNPSFSSVSTSDWVTYHVDANPANSTASVELTFRKVQVSGAVTGPDGAPVGGENYDYRVRSTNPSIGYNIQFNCRNFDNTYKLSGLSEGNYAIQVVPKGNQSFTASFEHLFTIDASGNATDAQSNPLSVIDLQLTDPQLTGTVKNPVTVNEDAVNGGNVDILSSNDTYLGSIPVGADGTFKIGGLADGTYKIRANPPQNSGYMTSGMTSIEISTGACTTPSVELRLTVKTLKLKWVNNVFRGDTQISMRLDNISLLGNPANLGDMTATVSKNGVVQGIALTNPRLGGCWGEEGELIFSIDGGMQLPFGAYIVEVQKNGTPVGFESDTFYVLQRLTVNPGVVTPSAYQSSGTAVTVDVEERNGSKDYPWSSSDTLTVKVMADGNPRVEEHSIPNISANGTDNTISLSIPSTPGAAAGRRDIEVYNGTQLLAQGSLNIGDAQINEVYTNENSNEVLVAGDNLGIYQSGNTYAEVWLNNAKIAGSTSYDIWNEIHFRFDTAFDTGKDYMLKIFADGQEKTPNGGIAFKVIPGLVCDNPVFVAGQEHPVAITGSSISGFGWSSADNLTVKVYGPGLNNFSAVKGNGITVNDGNLVLTMSQGLNYSPLQKGDYKVEIFKGSTRLGTAEFMVVDSASDVLQGTVVGSDTNPVNAGKLGIQKENDGWGDGIPVGSDGKFYYKKDRFPMGNRDGNYILTAYPPAASSDAPGTYRLNITGNNFASNNIVIQLQAIQIQGTVKVNGSSASGGFVDVFNPANNWERVAGVDVGSDGSYKIGGLNPGTYCIRANPSKDIKYLPSDDVEISIDGSTVFPVTRDLVLCAPQVTGTAKGFDNSSLNGDSFDVSVRAINTKDEGHEWRTYTGEFIIGKLKPGTYAVSISPRGDSAYTQSDEVQVTIAQDGTATPAVLNLKLTQPKLTGTVCDNSGAPLSNTNAYISIFKGSWTKMEYMGYAPVSFNNGSFKIGGLPDGEYYLQAGVKEDSPLYNANAVSALTKVTLGTTLTQNLTLTDRSKPRIRWIDDAGIGDNRINVRLYNFRNKDMSKFRAEILTEGGSSLSPAVAVSDPGRFNFAWRDDGADEADLEIYVDGNINLAAGKYTLKLTYNNIDLLSDSPAGKKFSIYYTSLSVSPKGARPEQTQGLSVKMFIDDRNGGVVTGVWNTGDTLDVKLTAVDGHVYDNLSYTINPDGTITAAIPGVLSGGALPDGFNTIEVYRGGVLLAQGGIIVGIPAFAYVDEVDEGDNYVAVEGDYLAIYDDPGTYAEVLDAGNNVIRTSNDAGFRWGRLEFKLGGDTLPAGKYKLRITYKGAQLAPLDFSVVPQLISTPHAISGAAAANVILKNSTSADFMWNPGDAIADFTVKVKGPNFEYDVHSYDGLSFDGDKNLVVNIKAPEGWNYPLQNGGAYVSVYKNDKKIGFSLFTIGNDVITGTVYQPDGVTPVPLAKVKITNLSENDYSDITVTADSQGKFYIAQPQDLPRNNESHLSGNYSFLAIPPQGSLYAAATTVKSINSNGANTVTVNLAVPQITGTVKAGLGNASGGKLEVQQDTGSGWNYLYDIDINSDGTFRLGGLQKGTYYLKAHAPEGPAYVSSNFKEVVLGDDPVTVEISLTPVQFSGAVTDALGNPLKGDRYDIDLKQLNVKDGFKIAYECAFKDGEYAVGGLEPGTYTITLRTRGDSVYSQSNEAQFTINNDKTASDTDIPLQLTQPKLVGTVVYGASVPFTEGNVEVFKGTWQNAEFVTGVNLDKDGKFRIGGLPNGKYYIRATLWDKSPLRATWSQSITTEINLVDNTPAVQLALRDKTPRIKWIEDAEIGKDMMRIHLLNAEGVDFSKMTAQILDGNGQPLSTPINISGAGNFIVEGESWDHYNDEVNVAIKIAGGINLSAGNYMLKLKYNNVGVACDSPDGYTFKTVYPLNVSPFGAIPEYTAGMEVGLLVDKLPSPWAAGDTLVVNLTAKDGTVTALTYSIGQDNKVTVTLPALAEGSYSIQVLKAGKLLAKGWFDAAYPKIAFVSNLRCEDDWINLVGDNLVAYTDPTSIVAKVYDSSNHLILTTSDTNFMWGNLQLGLKGMKLAPGDYRLEMTYKGQAVDIPGNGAFSSITVVNVTPAYLLTTDQPGKTITLEVKNGEAVPWSTGDTLKITVRNDWDKSGGEHEVTPSAVTASAITFTMPDGLGEGKISMDVIKIIDPDHKKSIAFAGFDIVSQPQMTGLVRDKSGNPVPYASIDVTKKGDNQGFNFKAGADGKYAIYRLDPGEYTVVARPTNGEALIPSPGFDITVNSSGGCSTGTYTFELASGKRISGTVSLPGSDTAPAQGMDMWLGASNDNGTPDNKDDDIWQGTEVRINAGENSAAYTVVVPDSKSYVVQLWGAQQGGYIDNVYYGTGGAAFTMASATALAVNGSDIPGINIVLAKGRMISGTASLPSGMAPAGGIYININAGKDNNTQDPSDDINQGTQVFIPQGQGSAAYKIYVPAASGYKVEYKTDRMYNYLENGYYKTPAETTYNRSMAAVVDASTSDQANIDLKLLIPKFISGRVSLPNGLVAPAGGLKMWIGTWNENGTPSDKSDDFGAGTDAFIPAGGSYADYKIMVPDTSTVYGVQLWCGGFGLIDGPTFYSSTGSVFNMSAATMLNVSTGDKSGINFTLVKGKTISGTVTLPEAAPSGGRSIEICAFNDNNNQDGTDDVVIRNKVEIPAGQTSANYTLTVPAMSGYRVQYIPDPAYLYEENGFYSTTGTVFDYTKASIVDVSSANASGINLSVSFALNPVCMKAAAIEDGTAIQLIFSKPLKQPLPASPAGFSVTVDGVSYAISGMTPDAKGTMLTLNLDSSNKIFSDYKNIKLSYSAAGGIKSYDGKDLLDITNMDVVNKSTKSLLIQGVFNGQVVNHDVVITVTSPGETIAVTENSGPNLFSNGKATISGGGNHTVTISSTGRKANAVYAFTIDLTPPVIQITNSGSVKNNPNGVSPVINFAGDCVATTKAVTLNGRPYDGGTIKAAGHYILQATAKDAAGNVGTAKQEFDIVWDTSAPVITIDSITNGGIYENAAISISLACDANTLPENSNAANYTYTGKLTTPDGSVIPFNSSSIPAITAEGSYRLEVLAVNPSYTAVTSSKVVEFVIDKTAPAATIGNVTEGRLYNTAVTPVISFSDAVASQQFLLGNATVALTKGTGLPVSVAYNIGDTISADGTYTLTAKTKDAGNHESAVATVTFTIDRTKPVITLSGVLNGYTYKDQNVTITAKTNEGTLTVLGNGQEITLDGSGQYTFTVEADKTVSYKLNLKAVDTAGNVTEQQVGFTIDRLAVNIIVNGISEGMLINYSPEISFTTFEGTTEKTGTTATIDGVAFTGGRYATAGSHVLSVKYLSSGVTYTKNINFVIDKTAPTAVVSSVLKNNAALTANTFVKAGDVIKVRATASDANGIGDVSFSIGTAAVKVPMAFVEGAGYYEGQYIIEGGNYADLNVIATVKDKAGNTASQAYTYKVTIDNNKPMVSMVTNPMVADGSNGLFKDPNMKITLTTGAADIIHYTLNGAAGTSAGTKELTPSVQEGTNILVYHAEDAAGNKSDEKVYVFGYDKVKPVSVVLSSPASGLVNSETVQISGTVPGEGSKTGTRVLLKKSGEIVAKATVKADNTFVMDGIRLSEGQNGFTLTAVDLAGNESALATAVSRTLDTTPPVVMVDKVDANNYTVTINESVAGKPAAKFNGIVVDPANITLTGALTYNVAVSGEIVGTNVLNITVVDSAGNTGTGSFTSTVIPQNITQNDVPLNDNATVDIPSGTFDNQTQMLVKTVDLSESIDYKLLGAPISFTFDDGTGSEPVLNHPLLIKNYIGVGLTGVVLMHITDTGEVDDRITAIPTTSGALDTDTMGIYEDGYAYYLTDTGYIVFKSSTFSGFGSGLDNTAPVITLPVSNDFDINAGDLDGSGKVHLTGSLTDTDNTSHISAVTVDGNPVAFGGNTSMAFDITFALTDGTHEVEITAVDGAGNSSAATKTYHVDITEPTLSATASATNTNRDTVDISVDTSENGEVFINGVSKGYVNGSGIIPVNLTNGADNTINVSATDAFGNTSATTTLHVTRDSTPPAITITGVTDGSVYGGAVTITVNVTDPHAPQSTVTIDGQTFNSGSSFSDEGQHTLQVDATDSYGNTSSATVTFAIDTSVPLITFTGADNGGIYNSNKTLAIDTTNADELIVTKAVDGQAAQNVTVTGTSTTVDLGTAGEQHSYKVTATARKTVLDQGQGQVKSAATTIEFTVDRKAPAVTSTTAGQTEATSINITGTVNEASDIYLEGVKVISGNAAGSFSITGQSLASGDNLFHVKAVDAAGNESAVLTITVKRVEPVVIGGGGSGGGIGGGAAGGLPAVTDDKTEDTTKPADEKTTIDVKPTLKGTTAVSATTAGEITEAFKQAQKDDSGVKTITIDIREVDGAKAYTQSLPASVMKTGDSSQKIEISTPLGTVTIPGNMFAAKDTNKKAQMGISIAAADTSKLDKDTLKKIGDRPVVELNASADGKTIAWSNPNAPVTVSIDYKPTAEELKNPDNIVVWYIDGKGKAQPVPSGRYDAATGKVTFTTTHFSKYAIVYVKKTFNDTAKLAARDKIEFVASKGIMDGTSAVAFSPNNKVTRAEFIMYLVNALGLDAEVKTNFADVKASDPYYKAVGVALKLGIVSGTSDNKFNPKALITREDMAVAILRAMKAANKTLKEGTAADLKKYSDTANISKYAVVSVATLVKEGIIKIAGKLIYPKGSVTRAEVAVIMYNIYKHK